MAEKDGRENLGDDLGQRQHLFLLELSSEFQDRVPLPGIVFARMIRSKDDEIGYTMFLFLLNLLTVSAPAETGRTRMIKKSLGRPRLVMYTVRHTCVSNEKHIFRNAFFPGPLRIALIRKTLNEVCCHGRCSLVILLKNNCSRSARALK